MSSCPKCGKEVSEGMTFCPNCGLKLTFNKEVLKLKIDETRHKEKIGYMTALLGVASLALSMWLGFGFTDTIIERYNFYHVETTYYTYRVGATLLLVLAVILIFSGLFSSAYHSNERSKLMKQIES